MSVPLTTFDLPADRQFMMPDGTLNQVWQEHFDRLGKAITIIREAADTATNFAEFQAAIQEIS